MEPFRYHVFVCDQQKPEGVPCCAARGSAGTIDALRREIARRGLEDDVQITACGSLGLCEHGPNMIVYPEGVWYSGVTAADVPEVVESHFENHTPVERLARTDAAELRAEVLANRQKMLAARRAKDAAGVLPDELAELARAFQESRVLLTALELDIFTLVNGGSSSLEVSHTLRTDQRATEMLLNALAAMGLLTKHQGVFRNTPAAARFLSSQSPESARMGLLHRNNLWKRWSTLTDCVRAGGAVRREGPEARDEDWTRAFIAAMHRNAREGSPAVVRAVGLEGVRRVLDVGGGSGAYSIAFAKANPTLLSEILDMAAVVPIAQGHIDEAGVADRVHVRIGDLRSGPLGAGFDLVFISAICHMLSPEENRDLLRRAQTALVAGGRIVIQEFILEPDKTAPKSAALFALNMLVGTASGSAYSDPEYTAWLAEAGFTDIRRVRLPGPAGLMIALRAQ